MSRYGRYEVIRELGRGAMAAVFQARDPVLTRFVAIKVLHKDVAAAGATVLQRFFNEAKTVANLRNPHVVEVFDFGKAGKEYYLVMEFVDGQSLHGLIKQMRPVPHEYAGATEPMDPLLTASIVCQAAEGLAVAAQHGVVHRDIKPENLMINSQGYLKVADFGIAHLQDDNLTRTGAVLGSPLYMSPEQVRGAKAITSQSDMFSLGAVFYRCLAGHPPFHSANLTELFRKIAKEPHIPLWHLRPDLDPTLLQISEILLQKDPTQRGGGPRWLRGELRSLLMSRGIADPMELVGAHLQELSARGIQTTWSSEVPALPRTVLNTRAASRRGATVPATAPVAKGGRGWGLMAVGLFFGLAVAAAAGLVYFGVLPGLAQVGGHVTWTLPGAGGRDARDVAGDATAKGAGSRAGQGTATGTAVPGKGPGNGTVTSALPQGYVPDAELEAALKSPQGSGRTVTASAAGAVSAGGPGTGGRGAAAPTGIPARSDATAPPGPTGEVEVQSSPPFAEIYLDGRFVGIAPVKAAALSMGIHRLLIKGQNTEPLDTEVVIGKGKSQVRVKLDPRNVALDGD